MQIGGHLAVQFVVFIGIVGLIYELKSSLNMTLSSMKWASWWYKWIEGLEAMEALCVALFGTQAPFREVLRT